MEGFSVEEDALSFGRNELIKSDKVAFAVNGYDVALKSMRSFGESDGKGGVPLLEQLEVGSDFYGCSKHLWRLGAFVL